jgi:YidC/Oxa1 family membrane protein insertase
LIKNMATQRLILWLIFSFSALMLWQAWEREHNPPVAQVAAPARPTEPGASPVLFRLRARQLPR